MSIDVTRWVWQNGPKDPTERMVLLAIADHCNGAGEAYPSMIGIATKACLTERGARNVVRRLEAGGWLETRVGGGRGGKSNYRVLMRQNPEPQTGNVKPGTTNPEPDDTKPGTSQHKTRNQRSAEPPRNHQGTTNISDTVPNSFDAFWSVYPLRKGKGQARTAYVRALRKASPEAIADGAKRYASDPRRDPKFTAHPATWLNGERWDDELENSKQHAPTSQGDAFLRRIAGARP